MKPRLPLEAGRTSLLLACLAGLLFVSPLRAQDSHEKIDVDDVTRTFVVHLPKGYDKQQHYPVVILLHGQNQDADDMARLTRFNELADKDSVIAVYPNSARGRWNIGVQPRRNRAPWDAAEAMAAAEAMVAEATQAVEEAIPVAEAEDIPVGATKAGRSKTRRLGGRPPPMTLPSSTKCWTRLQPNIPSTSTASTLQAWATAVSWPFAPDAIWPTASLPSPRWLPYPKR